MIRKGNGEKQFGYGGIGHGKGHGHTGFENENVTGFWMESGSWGKVILFHH